MSTKKQIALAIIRAEVAEHGKETQQSIRARVENRVTRADCDQAAQQGLEIFNAAKLGGCCDACGETGANEPDEVLCRLCKLKAQRRNAEDKGWDNQRIMIDGMIRDLREQMKEAS